MQRSVLFGCFSGRELGVSDSKITSGSGHGRLRAMTNLVPCTLDLSILEFCLDILLTSEISVHARPCMVQSLREAAGRKRARSGKNVSDSDLMARGPILGVTQDKWGFTNLGM